MEINLESLLLDEVFGQTSVRSAPLADALRGVRAIMPSLEVAGAGSPDATLLWRPGVQSRSGDLGAAFWDFMALAEAADEDIVKFARRHGPLYWPVGEQAAGTRERGSAGVEVMGAATGSEPFKEPIWAWKSFARSLAALYDLVDPALELARQDHDREDRAIGALAVPLWLRAAGGKAPIRSQEEVNRQERLPLSLLLLGYPFHPHWLVSTLLRLAGVGPAYDSPSDDRDKPAYVVPVAATRPYRPGKQAVRGLLPVLAVSLAIASQSGERPRCTRCGKPAEIVERGPRRGRDWYGNHFWCRQGARSETMARAEAKRAASRASRSMSKQPEAGPTNPPVEG